MNGREIDRHFGPDFVCLEKVFDTNWDDDYRLMIMWKDWLDFSLTHYFTSHHFLVDFEDELSVAVLHPGKHGPFPMAFQLHPRPNVLRDEYCLRYPPTKNYYVAKHEYTLSFLGTDLDKVAREHPTAYNEGTYVMSLANTSTCCVTIQVIVDLHWEHVFNAITTEYTFEFFGCELLIDVKECCPNLSLEYQQFDERVFARGPPAGWRG
jgi:hypothetical protein